VSSGTYLGTGEEGCSSRGRGEGEESAHVMLVVEVGRPIDVERLWIVRGCG
jgi:hypothetical protein